MNELNNYGQFDSTVQERLAYWYLITVTISYLAMFLNTAIIYDLKLVIQNPFQSSEKRVPKYIVVSLLLALIFSFTGLLFTRSNNTSIAEWNTRIYQIIALLNCIFATYTIIWLTKRF